MRFAPDYNINFFASEAACFFENESFCSIKIIRKDLSNLIRAVAIENPALFYKMNKIA